MKKVLLFLSSLTTLAMASNSFINTTVINKNNFTNNQVNNPVKALINNQYNALNNTDWITNQSTSDNKFYSYDTSPLVPYTFTNARDVF